jgi:hypothetical protein
MSLMEYKPVNESSILGKIVPWIIVVIIVSSALYLLLRLTQYKLHLDQVQSDASAFNKIIHHYSFPSSIKFSQGSIRGKILPINMNKMEIDQVYYDLPDQIRATNPNEVGTLAWLEWEAIPVGQYYTGKGYTYKCTLWLVDNSNSVIIARNEFLGTDPPEQKSWRGDAYGMKPDYKVIAYLINQDEPLPPTETSFSSSTIRTLVQVTFYFSWLVVIGLICMSFAKLKKWRALKASARVDL